MISPSHLVCLFQTIWCGVSISTMAYIFIFLSKFMSALPLPVPLSSFPRCDITNNLPSPSPLMAGAWAIISKLLSSNWLTASPQFCKQCSIANKGYSGENKRDGNPGTKNEREEEGGKKTKGKKCWNPLYLSKEISAKKTDWAVKLWLMEISTAHINTMDVFCVLTELSNWNFSDFYWLYKFPKWNRSIASSFSYNIPLHFFLHLNSWIKRCIASGICTSEGNAE